MTRTELSLSRASKQWSTMSSTDLKTRVESQFSRMNCQMFSCGLSSEHRPLPDGTHKVVARAAAPAHLSSTR